MWQHIRPLILYGLVIVLLIMSVKRVNQTEVMLIERFGKFQKILKPGIHFILPFAEAPRHIHWRHLVIPPGAPALHGSLRAFASANRSVLWFSSCPTACDEGPRGL